MSKLHRGADAATVCQLRLSIELDHARAKLGPDDPDVVAAGKIRKRLAKAVGLQISEVVERLVTEGNDMRNAVVARRALAEYWPLRMDDDGVLWHRLRERTGGMAGLPEGPQPDGRDVLFVVQWVRERDPDAVPSVERVGVREMTDGRIRKVRFLLDATTWADAEAAARVGLYTSVRGWPGYGLALVYAAWMAVRHDRGRPALAIDAGRTPVGLVEGMLAHVRPELVGPATAPRRKVGTHVADDGIARVALLAPGDRGVVQLDLPIDGGGLSPHVAAAMRHALGAEGVRHWLALIRLWSVEGGRTGSVRWTLDDHIAAVGLGADAARRSEVRDEVRAIVETIWRLELVTYRADGTERTRRKLFTTWERREGAGPDGGWHLEGATIQINPELWAGVRQIDAAGKPLDLGTHWWPGSVKLAQLDHRKHPYAAGLGVALAAGFRYTAVEDWPHGAGPGDEVLHRSARSLMTACGMEHDAARAARSWERLGRELDALVVADHIHGWRWLGAPGLGTQIEIRPPEWALDRAVRGVAPVERRAEPIPRTGSELARWRKGRELSAAALARELGVDARTVQIAESKGERQLSRKLVKALTEKCGPEAKVEA